MYRRPPTYVRNDALTPGNFNQLAKNARELESLFRAEHLATGEHNTPLIPRALGTVEWSAAAKYNLYNFNADVGLTSTAQQNGRVNVSLAAGRYVRDSGPVMVQNASATGATKPCLSWATFFDSVTVQVYSTYWSGTLGVAGSGQWNKPGEDASFHLGVHSSALPPGATKDFGAPLAGGQGYRASGAATYTNELVQSCADLESALRSRHTNGAHDAVEIPKLWAHVQWNGRYNVIDQAASANFDGGGVSSVDVVSSGIADVSFVAPLGVTTYQVFVDVDFARLTGSSTDYTIACVPFAEQGLRSFRLYTYRRYLSSGVEYFDRASDVDFHLWVFHA